MAFPVTAWGTVRDLLRGSVGCPPKSGEAKIMEVRLTYRAGVQMFCGKVDSLALAGSQCVLSAYPETSDGMPGWWGWLG